MAQILIFFALLFEGSLIIASPSQVSPAEAGWDITPAIEYKDHLDETHFSYTVKTYTRSEVKNFMLEIPSCPELIVEPKNVRGSHLLTNIRGKLFGNDIRERSTWTYTLRVQGKVKSGTVRYSIDGSQNFRQEFSTGTINGPKCEIIPSVVCDCGSERYVGVCFGNTVRVPLISKSKYYDRLVWSTDYPGCSFSATRSETPFITFHGPVCQTEFVVTLTVYGAGHQVESCQTHITGSDTTPPTFGGVYGPTDITAPCDDIPAPLHLVAKDECDNDVDVTRTDERVEGVHDYSIIRTWVAVDDCDNKATYKQTVIVRDDEKPRLIGVPKDTEVECHEAVNPCVVVAMDNCDDVTVEEEENIVEGSCVDSWIIIRTWSAGDNSYNSVVAQQTVKVVDNEPPVIFGVPEDVEVDCNEIPQEIIASATDNCMTDVEVTHTTYRTPGTCPTEYTIVHDYKTRDECGNHVEKRWKIHIKDYEAPRLSDLQGTSYDGTVPCDDVPVPCVVEAVDNCAVYEQPLEATVSKEDVECEGNYTLIYIWYVEDECGNKASTEKRIIVRDIEAPKFSLKVPETLRSYCTHFPAPIITAIDDCNDHNNFVFSGDLFIDGAGYDVPCDYNYDVKRTWTATDDCGNTAVMEQVVHVTDELPPDLIGVPPDMTIPCDNDLDFSQIEVQAMDNCDCVSDVEFVMVKKYDIVCPHTYKMINKWSVADCCGHSNVKYQTVSVYDDSPPSFLGIPGNEYVPTEHVLTFPMPVVEARDNCFYGVEVTSSQLEHPGSCPHNFMVIRRWDAEDVCGNTISGYQSLYCDDITPPTFDNEGYDSFYECPEPKILPEITITDNVDNYMTTLDEEIVHIKGTCPETYVILRQMTATDPCGNTAQKTYTIWIVDTTPPEWETVPYQTSKYIVIGTREAYSLKHQDLIHAIDFCAGPVDVIPTSVTQPGICETEYKIFHTWSAADNCGNVNEMTRTIDVKDQSAPEIHNPPQDTTVDCKEGIDGKYTEPTASDYGYHSVVPILRISPSIRIEECENNVTVIKCWKASDCVGHTVQVCQTLKVYDREAPVFGYHPTDVTVECDQVPAVYEPVATDDCGPNSIYSRENRIDGTCDHDYFIVRSWTTVDLCDNEYSMSHTITVFDDRDPRWTYVPDDVTYSCEEHAPFKSAICEDDCDYKLHLTNGNHEASGSCIDEWRQVRTWRCADDCGNFITASQNVNYVDDSPPFMNFNPIDVDIQCMHGGTVLPLPPGIIMGLDNCDTDVEVELAEYQLPGHYGNQSGVTVREWTAKDNCGNTYVVSHTLTVYDISGPTVIIPASFEVHCLDAVDTPTFIKVFDDCDPNPKAPITFKNIGEYDCHNQWVHQYCWEPFDKTGNYGIERCMTISTSDITPPVWDFLPNIYTVVDHMDDYGPATLNATDECDGPLSVTWTVSEIPGSCILEKHVFYTYTAVDWCGNAIEWKQTFVVADKIPPIMSPLPEDEQLECPAQVPDVIQVTSFDSYSNTEFQVEFWEQEGVSTCEDERIVIRRWVARDCTGNSASWIQSISIVDTNKPYFLVQPEDKTMQCDPDEYVALEAYDDCDSHVDVDYTFHKFDETDCGFKLARMWVATDNCGLSDFIYQTITVIDTIDPSLYGQQLDVTVDNHNVPIFYNLTCADNCRPDSYMADFRESTINGTCPQEFTIIREWCCEDDCGAFVCESQTVEVVDNAGPEISYCPADITVQTTVVPIEATLTAIDDQVYGEVPVVFSETNETAYQQEIMYTLWRTWTATDDCGNTAYCHQTVLVIDTVPPIIPDVPRDQYYDCDDPLIWDKTTWDQQYQAISQILINSIVDVASVTITPGQAGPFPFDKYDITCKGEFKVKRTWTATDHAGNSLSDTQIITVVDNKPPTFSLQYANLEEKCSHTASPDVDVTDNCDEYVHAFMKETIVPGTCPHDYSIERVWSAKDSCGNEAKKEQTVYVRDDGPPVFTEQPDPDNEVDCTFYHDLPRTKKLNCTDECDGTIIPKFSSKKIPLSCDDNWRIYRTWVCTDECQNTAYAHQTITIVDKTPPIFDGDYVPSVEINCDEAIPVPTVTASDECSDVVEVHSETIGYTLNYENMAFTQSWIAWDICGNKANKSRNVTVVDRVPPHIHPKPYDKRIPCDEMYVFALPEPTCEDNCGIPVLSKDVVTLDGTCEQEYDLIVTWRCVDLHDLVDEHTFTITVFDSEAPTISSYAEMQTYFCDDIPEPSILFASDNCDDVSIDFVERKEWPQYVIDSTAGPVEVATYDKSFDGFHHIFASEYYAINTQHLSAYTHQVSPNGDMKSKVGFCEKWCKLMESGKCFGWQLLTHPQNTEETYCYMYSKEQICDVQKEAYKIPVTQSKVTYGTGGYYGIKADGGICNFTPEPVHICDDYDLIRTWTAEDDCGNTLVKEAVIKVVDLYPPYFIDVPVDMHHDCVENNTYVPLSGRRLLQTGSTPAVSTLHSALHGIRLPTAVDNCAPKVEITEDFLVVDKICEWTYKNVYTWTATDDCGQKSTALFTVTKSDSTPPTIGYVADAEIECDEFEEPTEPSVTDDCGSVTLTHTKKNKAGTCSRFLFYYWKAEDECGNIKEKIQKLFIDDTEPPKFIGLPDDINTGCRGAYPSEKPGCQDDCTTCAVTKTDYTVKIHCGELYIQRYIATDECGNYAKAEMTVTKVDATPPVLQNVPKDTTVECDWVYQEHGVTAIDDCGDAYLTYHEDRSYMPCLNGTIQTVHRKWTAVDICGLITTDTQKIVVVDRTLPTLQITENVYDIGCDASLPQVNAIADDDCGEVTVTKKTIKLDGSCDDEYTVKVVFTAVDQCGNTVVKEHITNVTDRVAPIMTPKPIDQTVACDLIPDPPLVTAEDDCAYVTVKFKETSDRVDYSTQTYNITRCWSVYDNCGNSDKHCHVLTVQDVEPPTLTCAGVYKCTDIVVECEVYPALPPVDVKDNCYEHLEINYTAYSIPGTCIHDHIEVRKWTTDDSNGGTAELVQTVTYIDNTSPVLSGYMEDVTVECPDIEESPAVMALDNCDYAISVDVYESPLNASDCANVYTHWFKWTATDFCGNTDWFERTVTIIDSQPPRLSEEAENGKVECDNIASVWPGAITAADDCDYTVSVKFTEDKSPGTCPDSFYLIRWWTASDCTGNSVSHSQTVFVDDTIPPWFKGEYLSDITVDQAAAYDGTFSFSNPMLITADDNCADVTVAFEEHTLPLQYDCDYMYYRIRVWTIEDDCSNEEVMTQTIEMVRTTAPDLEEPADVHVDCDSIPPPCDVKVKGDFEYSTTVTFSELTLPGSCPSEYKLLRTWIAFDCADNRAAYTQTIHVTDQDPPVLTRYPEDMTVECDCDALTAVPEIDAVDNCDLTGADLHFSTGRTNGTCEHEFTITRTWTAEDKCGNEETHSQDVSVTDQSPPLFCDDFCYDGHDSYSTVSCDQVPEVGHPLVKDDCDSDPELVLKQSGVISNTDIIPDPGFDVACSDETLLWVWTAFDACGNEDECRREIETVDDTPPECLECGYYCYPFNDYGERTGGYAVYAVDTMVEGLDNCYEGVVVVKLLSCNSTQYSNGPLGDELFDTTNCVYVDMNEQLYVKLYTDPVQVSGRYYYVWFELSDNCGNKNVVSRTIWIPASRYSYVDAVEQGFCDNGLGNIEMVQNLPVGLSAKKKNRLDNPF